MSIRIKRNVLLLLLFLAGAALMVQCTSASAPSQHSNGLTCQSYTSSSAEGFGITKGADCRFKCPDGRLLSLPQAVASESKDQLNFLFCGVPLPTATAGANASAAGFTPTATLVSPLNRIIQACDLVHHILNFSFVQPAPDLTGETLTVEIQGQPLQCSVPVGWPNTYSCKLPPHLSFPAGIVVKVNGQVVDLFPYGGFSCETGQPTRVPGTPKPTLVPSSVPPTPAPTRPPTQPPPTPVPTQPPTQPPPTQPPTQPAPTQPPPPTTAPTDPPPTQAPTSQP